MATKNLPAFSSGAVVNAYQGEGSITLRFPKGAYPIVRGALNALGYALPEQPTTDRKSAAAWLMADGSQSFAAPQPAVVGRQGRKAKVSNEQVLAAVTQAIREKLGL